ncbi:MAG: GNAT family N-acetyltransferase [Acidobacteria bacterium]|nr:GNAT family N-acetyltransferase [Acidobacteriota bacterium]
MGSGVRSATVEDWEAISRLNEGLGRHAEGGAIKASLARLLGSERDLVVVAESDGRVVGWVHAAEREILGSGRRSEIVGLVVDDAYRGRGTGRSLVAEAEAWARSRGIAEVVVRSNIVRPESHPFYERLGYARSKTQHVYRKPIPTGGAT